MSADKENATKAYQGATMLRADLLELMKTDSYLLSDVVLELIQKVSDVEIRLKRISEVI